MPRLVYLPGIKTSSAAALTWAIKRYKIAAAGGLDYSFVRWIAQMTAVEIHSVWERYVENRLVAALNHDPAYFLPEYGVRGVKRITAGLAFYLVRGGGKYFDFRSMSDLLNRADRLVGQPANPFRALNSIDRDYIDTLSAVRNCVVHRSEAAVTAYKRSLKSTYGIKAAPEADEFLNALDSRTTSPARYKSRLEGLAAVVARSIKNT